VKTLLDETQTAGYHTLVMDAGELAMGVYTANLKLISSVGTMPRTIKIIRIK
jgi:hypothetical protein